MGRKSILCLAAATAMMGMSLGSDSPFSTPYYDVDPEKQRRIKESRDKAIKKSITQHQTEIHDYIIKGEVIHARSKKDAKKIYSRRYG